MVVIANGIAAPTLWPGLPVRPVKGEVLRLRWRDGCMPLPQRVIRARVHGRQVYLVPRADGVVVGATQYEHGRDTVYRCLDGGGLPWLAPVGRLDKASEGLLLFANDPVWAAAITRPLTGPHKTYHVQIHRECEPTLPARLEAGLRVEREFRAVMAERFVAGDAFLLKRGFVGTWHMPGQILKYNAMYKR